MKTRLDEMRENAQEFHRQHPEVWDLFERFAFDRIRRGFKHYSARGIWHRIRWETESPEYDSGKHFKLGDHHTPFYARRFMRMYPQYGPKEDENGNRVPGFFRTKKQISAGKPALDRPTATPDDTLPDDLDSDRWSTF